MELQLNNNNNNNNILSEHTLKNEIDNLSKHLENLKDSNESMETKNKETLKSLKDTTSLRIRILQSQERLLKDQIQQLLDNPINTSKELKFNEIEYQTELELVNLIDQLGYYESSLKEQSEKIDKELANEKRLLEETKIIGKNLIENDKALQRSKEIISKQLIYLVKKEDFQTQVLLNFIKNYSSDLFLNKDTQQNNDDLKRKNITTATATATTTTTTRTRTTSPTNTTTNNKLKMEENLVYILQQLMNVFIDNNQRYTSIKDPILTPQGSNSSIHSISEEIELLYRAGIIEKDPTEPNLIRIVPIL
ncbi:hypothetical protein DICPUDRAFT_153229 [Dictyostelium purpureum]|uniref:Uncharacterized protein n=1 Tax=Dictyostelium purpureum TaxID=5786 RepID=F0ZND2_DICPU|nr:uncharacterized protein DICPUDRAFT_153229 [Dictyostelium purpureum]EGC34562.1 hypothetical protein DICPUDRAFT_153229 [Dictyostelium purpureum]|eukprot:XP_003288938.1 hypothetical protein DICPUDRAFT_153229 [Dictyostelium purpureum]